MFGKSGVHMWILTSAMILIRDTRYQIPDSFCKDQGGMSAFSHNEFQGYFRVIVEEAARTWMQNCWKSEGQPTWTLEDREPPSNLKQATHYQGR
jgi:hypothetical protein